MRARIRRCERPRVSWPAATSPEKWCPGRFPSLSSYFYNFLAIVLWFGPVLEVDGLRTESAAWFCCALVQLRFRGKRGGLCECQEKAAVAWPCGHCRCEDCLWSHVAELNERQGATAAGELRCPECRGPPEAQQVAVQSVPAGKEDWSCGRCSYTNFARRESCRNCEAPRVPGVEVVPVAERRFLEGWEELSASERRAAALERFLALPEEVPEPSKEKFQVQAPRTAALLWAVGPSRSDRLAALHSTAAAGDVLRLQALLDAGVDVDARNERLNGDLRSWKGTAVSGRHATA